MLAYKFISELPLKNIEKNGWKGFKYVKQEPHRPYWSRIL